MVCKSYVHIAFIKPSTAAEAGGVGARSAHTQGGTRDPASVGASPPAFRGGALAHSIKLGAFGKLLTGPRTREAVACPTMGLTPQRSPLQGPLKGLSSPLKGAGSPFTVQILKFRGILIFAWVF